MITHNATFSACEKGQQPTRALELLAEMQGRELKPGVFTYNATISALQGYYLNVHLSCLQKQRAISACEKGQQPERALELLAEMQGQGLQPDVITYSATISACAKGHQPERALELLADKQGRGLDPSVITYSAAFSGSISACEKGQQPERALEQLADMQGQALKPDVITYNAKISACAKGHCLEQCRPYIALRRLEWLAILILINIGSV